jgi:hypothetical protein
MLTALPTAKPIPYCLTTVPQSTSTALLAVLYLIFTTSPAAKTISYCLTMAD